MAIHYRHWTKIPLKSSIPWAKIIFQYPDTHYYSEIISLLEVFPAQAAKRDQTFLKHASFGAGP